VGNGASTLLWLDRWLHGQSIAELAQVFAVVSNRRAKERTAQEALTNNVWARYIRGGSGKPCSLELLFSHRTVFSSHNILA
jgi:hypothetical protein